MTERGLGERVRHRVASVPARSAPPRPRALGAVARAIDRLVRVLAAVAALLLLALVVLIDADVLGRALGRPVRGVAETVSLAIVAITFLALPDAARRDALTRATALPRALGRRAPRLAAWLDALGEALAALVVARLLLALLPQLAKAWTSGAYLGALGDFTVPLWPVHLVAVVGCATLVITFAARAPRALGQGRRAP